MLKIKDNVDLKELEKFNFKEYNDCWQRDYEWSFLENKYYENSGYKIKDLFEADLVEKID